MDALTAAAGVEVVNTALLTVTDTVDGDIDDTVEFTGSDIVAVTAETGLDAFTTLIVIDVEVDSTVVGAGTVASETELEVFITVVTIDGVLESTGAELDKVVMLIVIADVLDFRGADTVAVDFGIELDNFVTLTVEDDVLLVSIGNGKLAVDSDIEPDVTFGIREIVLDFTDSDTEAVASDTALDTFVVLGCELLRVGGRVEVTVAEDVVVCGSNEGIPDVEVAELVPIVCKGFGIVKLGEANLL